MKKIGIVFALLALTGLAVLNWALPSQAAVTVNVIEVTTTADTIFPDDACSLREAIDNINTYSRQDFAVEGDNECPAGSTTLPNIIVLESGAIYTLSNPGNDNLTGDLDILEDMRIEITGGTERASIVMAVAGQRVMEIHAGATVELDSLALYGGTSNNAGGAILNSGHITFSNGLIQENTALAGAGLYNGADATAVLIDSQVVLNTANDLLGGGGIVNFGSLTLDNTMVRANSAIGGSGGGIHNNGGQLTIQNNSAVNLNNSASVGGGIYNHDGATTTISGSMVEGNTATNDGAGIYNTSDSTLLVNMASSINGNTATGNGGGIYNDDGEITINYSHINQNEATHGGGIYNVATMLVNGSNLEENSAQRGGGIVNNGGMLTIAEGQIVNNTASFLNISYGGGIFHFGGGNLTISDTAIHQNEALGGYGGGLAIDDEDTTTTITRSSITHNEGNFGGGGIWAHAAVTLANVTISHNSTTNGNGSGIYIDFPNGDITATNVTIANNMPGIDLYKMGQLTLQNSIIFNLEQPNCQGSVDFPVINSLGNNLADDGDGNSCWAPTATDIITTGILLDPLADNGGNTLTHALQEDSPAIGHGNPAACAATPVDGVDQRGMPRPAASCDSGAFQTQPDRLYLPFITRQ